MTIRELLELFIDENSQEVSIWDNSVDAVVWTGYLDELPDEYEYAEISSIDNLDGKSDVLTVNIDTE